MRGLKHLDVLGERAEDRLDRGTFFGDLRGAEIVDETTELGNIAEKVGEMLR